MTLTREQIAADLVAVEDAATGRRQRLDGGDSFPDNELAHKLQDQLYEKVLRAIAAGAANAPELAAEALKATGLDFTRWYA